MKILILITTLKGGVNLANGRLKKALEEKDHEVDIISRNEDLGKSSLLSSIFAIRNYVKKNREKYDIIYSQDWSMALPLIIPYPLLWKKHFCCFCGLEKRITKIFQKIVGKIMGEKLIVIADSIKKRFQKATLIYRGIDYNEFKPLNKKREYIGWVKKSYPEMIDEDFLKKLSKETGIPYIIAEKIPKKKMNEFYNKCKVFISLPPGETSFNNVWAEAMASGVPLVIGKKNGLGEKWIFEGVENENPSVKEIAEIIKNFPKKDYRKWLIDNKISWDNSAKKILKVFKERKK